jgi:hypothetical protein
MRLREKNTNAHLGVNADRVKGSTSGEVSEMGLKTTGERAELEGQRQWELQGSGV